MAEENIVTSKRQLMRRTRVLKGQTAQALTQANHDPVSRSTSEKYEAIAITKEVHEEFCEAAGVKDRSLATILISEVMLIQKYSLSWLNDAIDGAGVAERAMAALREMRPSNAMEAMLAIQMIATHSVSIKLLVESTTEALTTEAKNSYVLWATRLMRVFNEQLKALEMLQGRTGQQKVTVEHVHVNAGGQAIVGAVTAGNKRHE